MAASSSISSTQTRSSPRAVSTKESAKDVALDGQHPGYARALTGKEFGVVPRETIPASSW